jgi:hypothetical protein
LYIHLLAFYAKNVSINDISEADSVSVFRIKNGHRKYIHTYSFRIRKVLHLPILSVQIMGTNVKTKEKINYQPTQAVLHVSCSKQKTRRGVRVVASYHEVVD